MPRLVPDIPYRLRDHASLAAAATIVCIAAPLCSPATSAAAAVMQTFSNASNAGTTGTFVVPAGITSIQVEAVGGKGGNDPAHTDALSEPLPSRTGGYGAVVSADMPVVPGEVLYVYVGGNGEAASASGSPAEGGANGGGGSGSSVPAGGGAGGGGGASDVRTIAAPTSGSQTGSLESRLLVAGGGGGAANAADQGAPGDGNGGNAGQAGPNSYEGTPAEPGTANANGTGAGGAGGTGRLYTPGQAGTLGDGGVAGSDIDFQGGGGGGGLYGGGGGASFYGQPGAGGSSWVEQAATAVSATRIDTKGEPIITISYEALAPSPTPAAVTTTTPAPSIPPAAPVVSDLQPVHRCVASAALVDAQSGKHGLAFSFSLSEAANVTFAVLHRVGSPAWARCPRRRGHTPSTYREVGALSGLMQAGQQTTSLGTAARVERLVTMLAGGRHRIGVARIASRRLRPGTYVLSVKAVNSAGETSGVVYAKFWVFS